jgi:acyl-CoA dehydrogenase
MDLGMTPKVKPLVEKVRAMVRDEIMPLEEEYEAEIGKAGNRFVYTERQTEILEGLKAKARERGLWNFWLTASDKGYGLTTVEYAYLAEELGWSRLAPETFNCSAPDTGNMEVLERYGSPAHKEQWLKPLLEGKIRSAYVMTEPGVASSDATNLIMEAKPDGDEWVLNGEKWFASGAGDPRCRIYIVMVCTDPDAPEKHKRHSQILVPAGTKGVEIVRPMHVYGSDDAPHGHMHLRFKDVRVPKDNLILGRGRGFEVSQGRLGPGRIHHCMRAIGQRQLRHYCREPHEDRDGPSPLPQGRLHDGHRLPARGGAVDLADQGGGAEDRAGDHGRGGADAWRHGRDPGCAARPHVDRPAHAASGRRPRRGASPPGRAGGAEAVYEPEDVRGNDAPIRRVQ